MRIEAKNAEGYVAAIPPEAPNVVVTKGSKSAASHAKAKAKAKAKAAGAKRSARAPKKTAKRTKS